LQLCYDFVKFGMILFFILYISKISYLKNTLAIRKICRFAPLLLGIKISHFLFYLKLEQGFLSFALILQKAFLLCEIFIFGFVFIFLSHEPFW